VSASSRGQPGALRQPHAKEWHFCVVIEPPCTQLPRHGDSMCVCLLLAHLMRPVGRGRCRVRRIMASYSRSMVWLKLFAEAAARVVPTVAAARAVHPTDDGTRTQPTLLRRRG
jgi:hypothetical protein